MGLTLTVAPAVEPITVAEAKAHLRISTTNEDGLIASMISSARKVCEAYTNRQFCTATFVLACDDFPGGYGAIRLPRTPVASVTSITYADVDGSIQTLAATVYELVTSDVEARVVLKPGQTWPSVQSDKYNAVSVTMVCGYGAAADVPEAAKHAMKLLLGAFFENRESITERSVNELPTVGWLLDSIAVPKLI